ncbi:MAG: formylglycine-generating enzyme family protein [Chlorobium sp.]|nr:MAG: formylglycine-generating enzyme family protein [Chlorobium sp.]
MPEDFVHISGGEFTMGSPESEVGREEAQALYQQNLGLDYSETQHQVKVSDFAMSKYAVTVAEFRRFVEATGYQTDAEQEGFSVVYLGNNEGGFQDGVNWRHGIRGLVRPLSEDNHPVVHVSWNDAVAYCAWMSKQTGKTYRLPTEAEREYACRAGTTTPFNTGENLTTDQANVDGNYPYNNNPKGVNRENTVPVNSFAPNALGLYNMHGNVAEWCSDWFGERYYDACKASGTVTNPAGPSSGFDRVLRGGSWNRPAMFCRTALRNSFAPDYRNAYIGFRLVLVP